MFYKINVNLYKIVFSNFPSIRRADPSYYKKLIHSAHARGLPSTCLLKHKDCDIMRKHLTLNVNEMLIRSDEPQRETAFLVYLN